MNPQEFIDKFLHHYSIESIIFLALFILFNFYTMPCNYVVMGDAKNKHEMSLRKFQKRCLINFNDIEVFDVRIIVLLYLSNNDRCPSNIYIYFFYNLVIILSSEKKIQNSRLNAKLK